jgi:hypothetical protein
MPGTDSLPRKQRPRVLVNVMLEVLKLPVLCVCMRRMNESLANQTRHAFLLPLVSPCLSPCRAAHSKTHRHGPALSALSPPSPLVCTTTLTPACHTRPLLHNHRKHPHTLGLAP